MANQQIKKANAIIFLVSGFIGLIFLFVINGSAEYQSQIPINAISIFFGFILGGVVGVLISNIIGERDKDNI